MRKKQVLFSFDVFDTCIVRTCGAPSNFMEVLSYYVFKGDVSNNDRLNFIFARHKAELEAANRKKQYNIYDIYDHLSFSHPLLHAHNELPKIELELEKNITLPVYSILTKIKKARELSHKVIFISDMYIPTEELWNILSFHGLIEKGDCLYVSCDCHAEKHDGSIYRMIKEKENVDYSHWFHWGDNETSDIKKPKELGIRCNRVEHQYSLYQKRWTSVDNSYVVANGNYRNSVAGLSRAINVTIPFHSRNLLLADVIAPLYCSFVYKAFSHAKENGIDQLYFLARDTYHLYTVAKQFQPLFPEVSIRYLRISRRALYHTDEELLIKYLEQEGLASTKKHSAIVDSTSSGKTGQVINSILSKYSYHTINTIVMIKYNCVEINKEQHVKDYLAFWSYNASRSAELINEVIEYIFSSNADKRTVSYSRFNNQVTPLFGDDLEQDVEQPDIKELQNWHTVFLQKYAKYFLVNKLHLFAENILNEISFPTLSHFFKYPFRQYTESLIGCIYHRSTNDSEPLVKKMNMYQLIRTRGNGTLWPRATVFYNMPQWILRHFIKRRIK